MGKPKHQTVPETEEIFEIFDEVLTDGDRLDVMTYDAALTIHKAMQAFADGRMEGDEVVVRAGRALAETQRLKPHWAGAHEPARDGGPHDLAVYYYDAGHPDMPTVLYDVREDVVQIASFNDWKADVTRRGRRILPKKWPR